MGALKPSSPNVGKPGYFLPKPVCAWLAGGFVSLALLHVLCCSPPATQNAVFSPLIQYINDTYNFVSSGPESCDYSEGRWVWSPGHARRYNATECNAKWGHDCIRNGRPDTGYLDWRWQPAGCRLPAFDAAAFLSTMRGKHVAFVGDSMARNQVQSLVCLLAASFPHTVVYRDPELWKIYFWRWWFPTHEVTISFYWAPFISKATGKAENDSLPQASNTVYVDALGDRWAADADTMDVVVLAAGHWLLNGAVYYNGSEMIGAHNHDELNTTYIGYALPLRLAYRKSVERLSSGRPRTLVLATFSPSHFERVGDSYGCPRKAPYREGEVAMRDVEKELVGIAMEEAEAARARGGPGSTLRVEVLSVTKLAKMRPDGHPGVYMYRDAPSNGKSDCLHFCLPGPVDTFNEILQQILTKRR
ncbi:hypothetical protein ACP70R_041533 [Stipagrostis hirtigluma subsp. patula]